MTKRTSLFTGFAVAVLLPLAAQAQERRSPLEDAPAVRRRVELREQRFEIGVGGGTSVGQDFYHAVMVNARIGYHFTDWLAISGWGAFNVTPKLKTSFHERLVSALDPPSVTPDRTPTVQEATEGMNRIGEAFAGQLELIPFTGKFGLFSKLFMNYDFYLFGGIGAIDFKSDGNCSTYLKSGTNQPRTCPTTGFQIGGNFGVGMHLFANDFFALNFELRDLLVQNNAAGRDTDGDGAVSSRDKAWDHNFLFSLNLMFFLPGRADISP